MTIAIPSLRAITCTPQWVRNDLWRRARAVPSLDLRFAENKSLVDAVSGQNLITFTRASSGTYVDSAGVLRTAANDEPRFDHNPTTGESLGLLVEEQRTNLFQSSIYTANANGWTNGIIGGTGTITSALVTNKAGNTNGVFNVSGIDGSSYVGCFASTASSTNTYTASVFVKNNGGTVFQLRLVYQTGGTFKSSGTQYTFAAGTWADGVAGTTAPISRSVQDMGDGWFRFSITAADNGTGNTQTSLLLFGGSTTTNYNFYFWGAQLEAGAFPTSYIPTTTSAATRAADLASITGSAFSSWYRQDEGTMFCTFSRAALIDAANFANLWSISDNTASERYLVYNTGSTQTIDSVISDGGVDQVGFVQGGAITVSVLQNHCLAYRQNDFAAVRNAGLVDVDTLGSLPTVNRLWIGANHAGNAQFSAPIRRLTYWPVRLGNTTLQQITQ